MLERALIADCAAALPTDRIAEGLLPLDRTASPAAACARACDRRVDELTLRLARLEAVADSVDAGFARLDAQIASALGTCRQRQAA